GSDQALQHELKRLAIPKELTPVGKQPLFLVRAEGVQIYVAKMKGQKPQWELQGPKAVLLDFHTGEQVGTHAKGPVWVDSNGSKLSAVKRLHKATAPNPAAVDWLLLNVKNDNGGRFAKVTHIQRVDTWAGLAPAMGPNQVGQTTEVRYQA